LTARRTFEVIGLALLFLVGLEAASRIDDWFRFRTPLFARERSESDLLIRDALGMHGRPNGRFEKWSLNSLGMRGPEVPRNKPPGVLRVVTSGASETFGLYESPGKEYPRQLEDSLNARLQREGGVCGLERAEVLNAAMPGMSLPTTEQDIRLRVAKIQPDFVVLYATPPSYLEDDLPRAAAPAPSVREAPPLPPTYALFPRAWDRVRTQVKSLLPMPVQDWLRQRQIQKVRRQHDKGWRFTTAPEDRLAAFDNDVRRTVGTIDSIGAVSVLMTHANRFVGLPLSDSPMLTAWEKFYPRATGRTIVAFDSLADLRTAAVAADSGTVFVDLARVLAHDPDAFADFSHFTDRGAALIAKAASDAIWAAIPAHCSRFGQPEG
jgi:hypothetical protein